MGSNKISFDKLDKKLIKEMPLLIDVISSTFNKISSVLEVMYDDLENHVSKHIKGKKWKMTNNGKVKGVFYPFISEEYTNMTKINKLENYFAYENYVSLTLRKNKKEINFLWLSIGYWYNPDEKLNGFYFGLERWGSLDKYGGELFDIKFYDKLENKLKNKSNISIERSHPTLDEDDESFAIHFDKLDEKLIQDNYRLFKNEIVNKVLEKLE